MAPWSLLMPLHLWLFLLFFALPLPVAVMLVDFPVDAPVWWLTNGQSPELSIRGPEGVLQGDADAFILLAPPDRARVVSATLDGQSLTLPSLKLALDTTRMPDGEHRLEVVAQDSSLRRNRATAAWQFTSRNTGPAVDVKLDPPDGPGDGKTLLLRVRTDRPVSRLTGTIGTRTLRFQPDDAGGYWAVDGTPPEPSYSSLTLDVQATDDVGNTASFSMELSLVHTAFAQDDLELTPDLARLLNPQTLAAEDATFADLYRQDNGPKRWNGPFRLPVAAPITTEFGTRRSYENHPGADFGVALGAPVVAPADGVVAAIGNTALRGKVLILDHGAGVYSSYAHLQDTRAVVGELVKAGQTIAHVGNSGLSTGPHLHWELRVNGSDVDPLEWTRRTFP